MMELDFIEECYQETPAEAVWGSRLAERMAQLVPDALGVLGAAYVVESDRLQFHDIVGDPLFATHATRMAEDAQRCAASLSSSPHRRQLLAGTYGRPQPHVTSTADFPASLVLPVTSNLPWRSGEALGCFGSLDGNRGYFLGPASPDRMRVSRRRRQELERLAEHVATGYWLRALRPPATPLAGSAAAVCTPDGRVLHDAGEAPELSGQLVDAVRNMDRARCRRKRRSTGEATELWQALLAGQYTLVESFERDGRRLILAVRCRTPRPALTEREAAVAAAAARGAANKAIAAELGLATGTIGAHLATALRKLGCSSRKSLAQWLHVLDGGRS